jgi:hypothetical protein
LHAADAGPLQCPLCRGAYVPSNHRSQNPSKSPILTQSQHDMKDVIMDRMVNRAPPVDLLHLSALPVHQVTTLITNLSSAPSSLSYTDTKSLSSLKSLHSLIGSLARSVFLFAFSFQLR